MKTAWTAGLEEDQKTELRADFLSSTKTRKRLGEMLDKKIETARNGIETKGNYAENANWGLEVADQFGYIRALKEIKSLLK